MTFDILKKNVNQKKRLKISDPAVISGFRVCAKLVVLALVYDIIKHD